MWVNFKVPVEDPEVTLNATVFMLHVMPCSFFLSFEASAPQWARASSFTTFLDHKKRRTTVGRTPLDKWSARRRDLYLTNTQRPQQTSVPPVGFEPTVSAHVRPQAYALDCTATGIVFVCCFWRDSPHWARASLSRFLDHTRRTTVARTPLDEWSACHRNLYLTTHTIVTTDKRPCPGGIRTHNLTRPAAADLRLRPCCHWDRVVYYLQTSAWSLLRLITY